MGRQTGACHEVGGVRFFCIVFLCSSHLCVDQCMICHVTCALSAGCGLPGEICSPRSRQPVLFLSGSIFSQKLKAHGLHCFHFVCIAWFALQGRNACAQNFVCAVAARSVLL